MTVRLLDSIAGERRHERELGRLQDREDDTEESSECEHARGPVREAEHRGHQHPCEETTVISLVASTLSTSEPAGPAAATEGPNRHTHRAATAHADSVISFTWSPSATIATPIAARRQADGGGDQAEVAVTQKALPSHSVWRDVLVEAEEVVRVVLSLQCLRRSYFSAP